MSSKTGGIPGRRQAVPGDFGLKIVSAAHLAESKLPELSEIEFGLIIAGHAFERWMVRCMDASGIPDMSPLDVLVLHTIYHRDKPKKLADICLVLNVEDTHTVSYSIRKLERQGLIETGKQGKEKTAKISERGQRAVKRYGKIRNLCLVEPLRAGGESAEEMQMLARLLRVLSGYYDQAARAATSL